MPDIKWTRGSVGYKDANGTHTSTGVRVHNFGDKVSIRAFRLGSILGAAQIDIPAEKVDEFIEALYVAKRAAEKPKGPVRRPLSRL